MSVPRWQNLDPNDRERLKAFLGFRHTPITRPLTAHEINLRTPRLPYNAAGSGTLSRLVACGLLTQNAAAQNCGLILDHRTVIPHYSLTQAGLHHLKTR